MDHLKRRHISHASSSPYTETYEPISLHDNECLMKEKPRQRSAWSYSLTSKKFMQKKHMAIVLILTLISCWTRFRDIGRSQNVVWDEAHFGKFGSYYIKHTFYFDVHPPLGKMLVALSGWLAGYDGSFGFESGKAYPEDVNFVYMRLFNAVWGAMTVPIAYLTARELHFSTKACLLSAIMVLCDTAYLCLSRFILLDSMLLFFTSTSLYTLAGFRNQRTRAFSRSWWTWLSMTGLSLGCVLSVKWVGLFVVALVGMDTIEELWELLGDYEMPKMKYLYHWIARAICLIGLPAIVYMASFKAHFHVLYKSGPGDAQMSSLFQARLEGNSLNQQPSDVAYGSEVTIKNVAVGGGLLHSHRQTYPDGSRQQQVTCYHHQDENNVWEVYPIRDLPTEELFNEPRIVKNGDIVRLIHKPSGRNLHSHPVPAPVTVNDWEVSCYGNATYGDIQDNWRIEVVKDIFFSETENIHPLTTQFRLKHVHLGCYLTGSSAVLPQWGFRQLEVTCSNDADMDETIWNVEGHDNAFLPPSDGNTYPSSFLSDFWHLNVAMWRSNNALIPDPDKDDAIASVPTQWPLVSTGLRLCGWSDDNVKFFLLGNPMVWWPAIAGVASFCFMTAVYTVRQRRQIIDMSPDEWNRFYSVGKILLAGWFLHYMPFYIMGRVLYLHHYFPSLYFSIFLFPFLLDHFAGRSTRKSSLFIFGLAITTVIGVFIYFSPIAYGMKGPSTDYADRQWRNAWNIAN